MKKDIKRCDGVFRYKYIDFEWAEQKSRTSVLGTLATVLLLPDVSYRLQQRMS
jgi:hypothetical protein